MFFASIPSPWYGHVLQNEDEEVNFDVSESIVIIGFGQMGQVKSLSLSISFLGKKSWSCGFIQVLANFLSTPLVSGVDSDLVGWPYIGFDLNPAVVKVWKHSFTEILFVDML